MELTSVGEKNLEYFLPFLGDDVRPEWGIIGAISKTTASLEGRFFSQFIAYGYEEFFQTQINRLKTTLAVPTGDPAHDNSDTFKKEKALLSWLNKMSVSKLFDWFDAIQETTVASNIGKARWKTETIERDRLFLSRLGVIKQQI